jgi:hypothetical protein
MFKQITELNQQKGGELIKDNEIPKFFHPTAQFSSQMNKNLAPFIFKSTSIPLNQQQFN